MILRWRDRTTLPVEAAGIIPELVLGLPAADVSRMPLRVGNQTAELGDCFTVERGAVETAPETLIVEGDLRSVRGIGKGMSTGVLVVRGPSGPHLGAGMSGGRIEVHGDVGNHAGAEMRGGLLHIHGRAGEFLGASYAGSRLGMRDGVILVDGDVGADAGRRMRRGLIAVGGSAGDGFGRGLVAGSLFAFGAVGRHAGAGMKRGTIAALCATGLETSPSFTFSGCYRFPFLTVYFRRLEGWGFHVPAEVYSAALGRYNGDLADGGRGEILVRSGSIER